MPMTVKQIEGARYGFDKERLSDGGGLYLRLFPNGAKRFQVQVARAPVGTARGWVTLGGYPDISLKSARGLAARVRAMADNGFDIDAIRVALEPEGRKPEKGSGNQPKAAMREQWGSAVNEPTPLGDILLCDAAKEWFKNKRPTLSNGKHIDQNWNTIAQYILPKLGNKAITDIRRRDVIDALRPIWHTKNTTASRTFARLREIIELARIEHDLEILNPAQFCTKTAFGYVSRRTKHHAALPVERVTELWPWLEEVNCEETTRQAAQLLMLTAKRTNEVRFAQWSLIEVDAHVWTTPADLMKARLPHRVPLSSQARSVLENAVLLTRGKKLIFGKPKTKSGSFSENTILKLVKRFEPELTGHGLRANFKTWARQKRYDRDAIEFALAHVQTSLEEAYMRDDLIAERAALMQDWADFVTGGRAPASLRERLGLK